MLYHPQDSRLTWSGRGQKPKWVAQWLDAGNSLDDLTHQHGALNMATTQNSFACETLPIYTPGMKLVAGQAYLVPTGLIYEAPQVRTTFKESTIHELAADIGRRGVMQPGTVTPRDGRLKLVIGARRYRAVKHNGGPFLPAFIANVTDEECEEIQLVENIQREDLSAKDVAGSIQKLWKKHGTVLKVARACNKSKSWVSKRLAIAMKVGPLTAELLDASLKDIELIYLFTTLEKADEVAARELLPQLIEKSAGRREVKAAIAAALTSSEDDEGNDDIDTTMDLFDEPAPTAEPVRDVQAECLKIAANALRAILEIPKDKTALQKCEIARELARHALEGLQ